MVAIALCFKIRSAPRLVLAEVSSVGREETKRRLKLPIDESGFVDRCVVCRPTGKKNGIRCFQICIR